MASKTTSSGGRNGRRTSGGSGRGAGRRNTPAAKTKTANNGARTGGAQRGGRRAAKSRLNGRGASFLATGEGFAFGLAEIIDPVSPGAFFRSYWERKPLIINRRRPKYFQNLLTLEDTDRVITSLNLPYPEIELVNAKEQVTRNQYVRANNSIDVARLYDLFAEGATVILPHLHLRLPALAAFCRALEQEFSMPYQTNIYLTPANSQGFKSHYDTHDVFVLQVAGTKDWRIYDTPVELPHRGQRFNVEETKPGAVSQEFTLRPGDTVYIPRGIMHDAGAQKGTSLHITTGALAYTWTDLLLEAVSAVSLGDADFRRSLPVGFARPGYRRDKAKQEFKNLIRSFARQADFETALDQFADRITGSRAPLLSGQMAQVERLGALSLKTVAGPRPALIYKMFNDKDRIVVSVYGKEIAFPDFTAPSLRFALQRPRYRVGDLPGILDDDGKITLINRLVREGLVVIADN